MTGDNVTGDNVTGDNVTGDNVTGDNVTGDDVTGDDVTGDNVTGDDVTGDDVTGDTVTGDTVTGNAVTGDARSEPEREADGAWRAVSRRVVLGTDAERALLAAVGVVAATFYGGLAYRLGLLGAPAAAGASTFVAILLGGGPLVALHRGHRAARLLADDASRPPSASCPRCGIALGARSGASSCEGCGGALTVARGLAIAPSRQEEVRGLRWSAAAARALGTRPRPLERSALAWLALTVMAIAPVFFVTRITSPRPAFTTMPLGGGEVAYQEVGGPGTAVASDAPSAPRAEGPLTRPFAPLQVGTQVLAREASASPWLRAAVIVRARGGRAFVVFADGTSRWVGRRDVVAPELAPGDAIEVSDGARYLAATVTERIGAAVRVTGGLDGWTSAARVRVHERGHHRRGEGRSLRVGPGAFVEIAVGGALRPGIAVRSDGDERVVALAFGDEVRVASDALRPDAIGPGSRVYLDTSAERWIVAARIGDAIVVVDPVGQRRWTAIARVRRSAP
ncbi:MAG: hypothetical protein AB7S26_17210 [Sandaracinaceae bacterium]